MVYEKYHCSGSPQAEKSKWYVWVKASDGSRQIKVYGWSPENAKTRADSVIEALNYVGIPRVYERAL